MRRRRARSRARSTGQSLVEFSILVPAFMIILFTMLEFGFIFSHHLTLEYATREGARVGAALGNGTPTAPCSGVNPEPVDWQIIAAVQRVLTSPGSQVPPSQVSEIRIYKATASGAESGGSVNIWLSGAGPTVDGTPLLFKAPASNGWPACNRVKTPLGSNDADSIGVSLTYTYATITPLGALLKTFGTQVKITDRTVMSLNP